MRSSQIKDKPIIIIGCPRSGTTMLRLLLSNHSKIIIPHEVPVFEIIYNAIRGDNDNITANSLIELLYKDKLFCDLEIKKNLLLERISSHSELNKKEIISSIYLLYLEMHKPNALIWGDKTIGNIDFLENIYNTFPESRFIYLMRDPRDVLVSIRNVKWKFYKTPKSKIYHVDNPIGLAGLWNYCYGAIHKLLEKTDVKCHILKYEDLIKSPKDEMNEVFKFIGVESEESVFDFHKDTSSIPEKRRLKNHINTSKPIMNNNAEKYKTHLTQNDLKLIEAFIDKNSYGIESSKSEAGKVVNYLQYKTSYVLNRISFAIINRVSS